ncbi:hypothetical protein KDN24_02265 [Bacillus sp. Bva_UNVM-123]|uniref:hypothetical protein n=1 Tax=Bacillus sp. Bva_UNVM-123 TaxID=2829798 RepID=UPI00391F1E2C
MNSELKMMLESILKEGLRPIEKRFDSIDNRFDGIDNRFNSIEKRLGAIEMRQDGMKEEISAIRYNQEVTNATLKSLSEDVNYIKGDVSLLKENQERQEKILQTLSFRSIEQETELRELKRIK